MSNLGFVLFSVIFPCKEAHVLQICQSAYPRKIPVYKWFDKLRGYLVRSDVVFLRIESSRVGILRNNYSPHGVRSPNIKGNRHKFVLILLFNTKLF